MIQKMNTMLAVFTFILVLLNTRSIEQIDTKADVIIDELSYVSSLTVDQKRELERLVLSTNE
jgi:hypothetical protein